MIPARIAAAAALTCAATYLVGFGGLMLLPQALGYGTAAIDPAATVAFMHDRPRIMIAWNTAIYIVNALALVVLVTALSARADAAAPGWSAAARAIGLIWAALVLAAGMVANVAVERAAHLYPVDPAAAADLWSVLHAVELGLGGGNEIAGGAWLLCAGVAGLSARSLPKSLAALGVAVGISGAATVLPSVGDVAGAAFGLGAIAWFLGAAASGVRTGASRPGAPCTDGAS